MLMNIQKVKRIFSIKSQLKVALKAHFHRRYIIVANIDILYEYENIFSILNNSYR